MDLRSCYLNLVEIFFGMSSSLNEKDCAIDFNSSISFIERSAHQKQQCKINYLAFPQVKFYYQRIIVSQLDLLSPYNHEHLF